MSWRLVSRAADTTGSTSRSCTNSSLSVINVVEPAEERVFALRTDPLQFEMFSCNAFLNMRLEWQAPLLSCTEGFHSCCGHNARVSVQVHKPPSIYRYVGQIITVTLQMNVFNLILYNREASHR